MKKQINDLTEKEIIKTLDALYTAVGSLKNRKTAKLFLRDLLTKSERIMLGRRILIARLLISGTTYKEIGKRLGVGSATISRVEQWLQDQFLGYEQVIKGIEKEERKRESKRELKHGPFSTQRLKKKYPLHFLLFPIPKTQRKKH